MSFRNQVFQFLGRILNKGIDELHCVSRGLCTTPYSDHSLSILIFLLIHINVGTSDILNCCDVAPTSSHYSRYDRSWD